MKHHPPRRPAAPPAPAAAPQAPAAGPPGRDRWTPAKQRIFLAALLETGSVARAAWAAGMSRSSAHRLRRRLAGTPFDRFWDHVLEMHARRMTDPFAPDPAAPAPRESGSVVVPGPRQ